MWRTSSRRRWYRCRERESTVRWYSKRLSRQGSECGDSAARERDRLGGGARISRHLCAVPSCGARSRRVGSGVPSDDPRMRAGRACARARVFWCRGVERFVRFWRMMAVVTALGFVGTIWTGSLALAVAVVLSWAHSVERRRIEACSSCFAHGLIWFTGAATYEFFPLALVEAITSGFPLFAALVLGWILLVEARGVKPLHFVDDGARVFRRVRLLHGLRAHRDLHHVGLRSHARHRLRRSRPGTRSGAFVTMRARATRGRCKRGWRSAFSSASTRGG